MTTAFSHIIANGKQFTIISATTSDIVRESEKAVCLAVKAQWADGAYHPKDMWFPKSVVTVYNGQYAVAEWFYNKTSAANSFKGYMMKFYDTLFAEVELKDGKYLEC